MPKHFTQFRSINKAYYALEADPIIPPGLPTIPPGAYRISVVPSGPVLNQVVPSTEPVFKLPIPGVRVVIDEIQRFWDRRPRYIDYGVPHKRGILLYGPPGSGKSTLVREVCKDVIDRKGLVTYFSHPQHFHLAADAITQIQGTTPIVCIMEDVDSIVDNYGEEVVINLLDGFENIDRVLFLATTNHLNKLSTRIIARPSRFDRKIEIPYPTEDARLAYFTFLNKFNEVSETTLKSWAASTSGMSVAHIKELFISVVVLGSPFAETIENLRNMSAKELEAEEGKEEEE